LLTEKTGPRSSSNRFYNKLLLTCRCYGRWNFFQRSVIVEVGLDALGLENCQTMITSQKAFRKRFFQTIHAAQFAALDT